MGRRPKGPVVPPAQLLHVMEVLRQAEHMIERLAKQVVNKRTGVVVLPPEGYPLEWIERDAVLQAMEMSGWIQKDAAALLGLSARVMNYKVHHYGLRPPPDARVRKWRDTPQD